MSANNGIKIIISIISGAVVANEVLNFISVLVEESDILGNLFMNQLVIIQVLQGNISTQQIRKSYIFPRSPNNLEISELSNDHLISEETVR